MWPGCGPCVRAACARSAAAITLPRSSRPGLPRRHRRSTRGCCRRGGCVVAEDGQGVLLGFGVFDTDANEVDALFVDPDRGGKGIGQALMQRLLAMADRDREVVLSASLNAVPFYQRHGFISVREETYPHPSGVALASVSMRRPW
nr:GNAT family N-acetyltransferase [Stenotrophomonas maltophilia]